MFRSAVNEFLQGRYEHLHVALRDVQSEVTNRSFVPFETAPLILGKQVSLYSSPWEALVVETPIVLVKFMPVCFMHFFL